MEVLKARHMGMCFGVRRAIERAFAAAERERLTVVGDLVHNETVLADLARRGIRTCTEVTDIDTPTVMITAHGASRRRRAELRARGLRVLDATCPVVRSAHRAVAALVSDGYHPVIVGRPGHVEVRGLTDDLESCDVVVADEDVDRLLERPRFGIAAQTTQPVERVYRVAALIRRRFPEAEIEVMNTVCVPTRLRQQSAEELARHADVTLVVGGAGSNNTRELVATCQRHCARVFHVQSAADVDARWFYGACVAGITAGTSTPDAVIDSIEERVRELAARPRVWCPFVEPARAACRGQYRNIGFPSMSRTRGR